MTLDNPRYAFGPRMRWALVAASLLIAFGSVAPLFAQDWKGRGRVRGKVVNQAGDPVENAKITIQFRGQEGEGPEALATDDEGRWAYMGLSSAPYTIIVEAEGYAPSQGEVRVNEYSPMGTRPVEVTLRELSAQETGSGEGDRLNQLINEANALMSSGKYAESRARYEEVLAEVGDDEKLVPQLENAIAMTQLHGGQPAEARATFEKILATVPAENAGRQVELLNLISQSHYMQDSVDASVQSLERALAVAPDDLTTIRRLVDILVAAGREGDAEPYMARLPAGEKVDPNAMLNLGISAYNGGEMDTALEKFQAVIADYPDNANAHYYLGLVYLNKQMNPEALSAFEKMLALEPEHPNAGEAQQFAEYLKTL
ncbi:MAG: tetratricopeptide repeat protein [Acidobacteriota bacterium]